jgi:hypothetical protein
MTPPAPKRCLCYWNGDTQPAWFLSIDNYNFLRWGTWDWVTRDELILEASGLNDPEITRTFPMQQHSRFHPARNG